MSNDFTFTISSEMLSKGLRPSKRLPRDTFFLVTSSGAVGRDGVLSAIDSLVRFNTSSIDTGLSFPYPQIFVTMSLIIVCTPTRIYEYTGGTFVQKLVVSSGELWTLVDFGEFIYMSNGVSAVIRDVNTQAFSISSTLPIVRAACNFNGQVIVSEVL